MSDNEAPVDETANREEMFLVFASSHHTSPTTWETSCLTGDVAKLAEFVRSLTTSGHTVQEIIQPACFHSGFVEKVMRTHGVDGDPSNGLEFIVSVTKARRIVRQGRRLPESDWEHIAPLIQPAPDLTVQV